MNDEQKIKELSNKIESIRMHTVNEHHGLSGIHHSLNLYLQEREKEIYSGVGQELTDEVDIIDKIRSIFLKSDSMLFNLQLDAITINEVQNKMEKLYAEVEPIRNNVEAACYNLSEFRNHLTKFNLFLQEREEKVYTGVRRELTDTLDFVDYLTQASWNILHKLLDLQIEIITIIHNDYNYNKKKRGNTNG